LLRFAELEEWEWDFALEDFDDLAAPAPPGRPFPFTVVLLLGPSDLLEDRFRFRVLDDTKNASGIVGDEKEEVKVGTAGRWLR
jgi:hypothetical protein